MASLPAHGHPSCHDWSRFIGPLDVLNNGLQILCVGGAVRPRGLGGTRRQQSQCLADVQVQMWGFVSNDHVKGNDEDPLCIWTLLGHRQSKSLSIYSRWNQTKLTN